MTDLPVSGLFFAIGHEPATKFLGGQLKLDADGYIATDPGHTTTSVPGVFAAGDVQDKKWRQAITAAGSGAWTGAPSAMCAAGCFVRSCNRGHDAARGAVARSAMSRG